MFFVTILKLKSYIDEIAIENLMNYNNIELMYYTKENFMEDAIAYAEVFEILSYMDKKTVMKIPVEVLQLFKNERKKDYVSRINKNDLFNENNVSKQTRVIFAWLNLKYWATEDEKKVLTEIYEENKIKEEKIKQEKYSYEDIFDNTNKIKNIGDLEFIPVDEDKQLYIEKNNIFKKIKKYIFNFFRSL